MESDNPSSDDVVQQRKVSEHEQRCLTFSSKCALLRQSLIDKFIESLYPATFKCSLCPCIPENAEIYRCVDCGPIAYFCHKCLHINHQTSLHAVELWDNTEQCFFPHRISTVWKRPEGYLCQCMSPFEATVVVVNNKGQQQLQKLELCHCEERAVTLLSYGLWAASPKTPGVAFTIDLMLTARILVLEGQISLTSFCHGMQWYRTTTRGPDRSPQLSFIRIVDISVHLKWEVLLNFMELYHHVTQLQFAENIHTPSECMACPKEDDKRGRIICIDGNFRLVHRKAAGASTRQTLYKNVFFVPQHDADVFVESHSKKRVSQPKSCSNFQADSLTRAKNKTDKLDVTGVFGSVCSHDFPVKFLDMRHGERMGYPVYLMNSIDNISILLYDIGCQLEPHLKKHGIPYNFKIGLPVFHAGAHILPCQLTYSARAIEGAGRSDGEGTERLWSYLGRFSKISKEMTPENRTDVLTEGLLHYGNKLTLTLAKSLCQRLEKAYIIAESTDKELQVAMGTYPGITYAVIGQWSAERITQLSLHKEKEDDWRTGYSMMLFEYYQTLDKVRGPADEEDEATLPVNHELNRLDERLLREEKKWKVKRRWTADSPEFISHLGMACDKARSKCLREVHEQVVEYVYMERKRKKYPEGQKMGKRFSIPLKAASKKIQDAIRKYNAVPPHGHSGMPHVIERTQVRELEAPIWQHLVKDGDEDEGQHIPRSVRWKCMDNYNLHTRAQEDITNTVGDMKVYLKNIRQAIQRIQQSISAIDSIDGPSRLQLGQRVELKRHLSASNSRFAIVSAFFIRPSLPDCTGMMAFVQSLEDDLTERGIPEHMEGLSAETVHNVLKDVETVEEELPVDVSENDDSDCDD